MVVADIPVGQLRPVVLLFRGNRLLDRARVSRRERGVQRVEASSPFIAPAQRKACGAEPLDLTDVFAGLDLAETSELTALVLVNVDLDGIWHLRPTFWLPRERLRDKALADRAPCDLWAEQGFLQTTPGSSVSYEFVAQYLKEVLEEQLRGWVNYFAVGHSSECFSFVKDWVEKKIKRHIQRIMSLEQEFNSLHAQREAAG
jgi:hypothetical protein